MLVSVERPCNLVISAPNNYPFLTGHDNQAMITGAIINAVKPTYGFLISS